MRIFRTLALLWAVTLFPSHGLTSELSDRVLEAETLLSSGQAKEAYETLEAALDDYWEKSPMVVRRAVFVSEISGYGNYVEREAVFKSDEAHIVYVEPVAFSYGTSSDGKLAANWGVDYSLTGPSGRLLFEKEDFVELGVPLVQKNREIHLKLTINVSGLKPGNYVSRYLLKDKNSDKTTEFSLPFEINE